MDLECFSPFFPAQWRVLFFNTPDPPKGAKLTVVLSIQTRSILIFLLQPFLPRPMEGFAAVGTAKTKKDRFHSTV